MRRRQLIASAITLALLNACGGGGTAEVSAEASQSDKNNGQTNAFANAASLLLTSDAAASEFARSGTRFFITRGVSQETVDFNKPLISSLSMLISNDLHVAAEIGDMDYFYQKAVALKLMSANDRVFIQKRVAASIQKIDQGSDVTGATFVAVAPMSYSRGKRRSVAASLTFAAAFAAEFTAQRATAQRVTTQRVTTQRAVVTC